MFARRRIISMFLVSLLVPMVWATPPLREVNFSNIELSTLRQARSLGPVDPEQEITFTVWLKLRNKKQLDSFINELYDPQSALYQKFLTKEEYEASHAPSVRAAQKVENYFISKGMKTKKIFSTIQVTAKASQIEETLKVRLNNYSYKNKTVYGNLYPPKINSAIAQYISGISDLSNIPYGHPKIRHHSLKQPWKNEAKKKEEILNFLWASYIPQALPTTTSLKGLTGAQMRSAYNLSGVALQCPI